ncbi:DUF6464 family protein [Nostoc sp. CHAB 5824]|nr:DUF6464 family protein [Nostoc sp. CHAB 5824]
MAGKMISIRQRRRNRHRAKAAQKGANKPLLLQLTLGIDFTKVDEAFVRAKNAMTKLSETMALPEFQKSVNDAWQNLVRLVPLGISQLELTDTGTLRKAFNFEPAKAMLVADREAELLRQYELAHHRHQLDQIQEDDCLGNPSCNFNARSPHLQCTVNPSGNCATCRHFEI